MIPWDGEGCDKCQIKVIRIAVRSRDWHGDYAKQMNALSSGGDITDEDLNKSDVFL